MQTEYLAELTFVFDVYIVPDDKQSNHLCFSHKQYLNAAEYMQTKMHPIYIYKVNLCVSLIFFASVRMSCKVSANLRSVNF